MFIIVPVYKVVVNPRMIVYLENFGTSKLCQTKDEARNITSGSNGSEPLFDETNQGAYLSSISVYEIASTIEFNYNIEPFWWDEKTREQRLMVDKNSQKFNR